MGNNASSSSGKSAQPSSNDSTNKNTEGRSFGGTSFLEEAGAASIFKCGNPENVLTNKNGEVDKPYRVDRITMDNICTQPGQVLDGAAKWRNNGYCSPGPIQCGARESSLNNNAEMSDPEDEFQSLRKLQVEGDSTASKIFARSMVKELDDPGSLTMKEMVQREKMLLKHEQQLNDGSKSPNVFGGVVSSNASLKSISTSPSSVIPSKHRVTIGLCLSRYHPTLGHPKSVTRQTEFDFNELQDRAYKYVSSTDEHGWRAGGGEPGTKTHDSDINSALSYTSPDSPGGHSFMSHVKDTTGGGSKISSPDTVHIPIIEIDAQSEAHVQLIIHALAKGEIFIPHMSIMPEALGVIGASNPDLVVRFGCERNEDLPIEEWPNWCIEFMHNQLYDYFQPLGAIWNKRPFQITLARKVRWKTVKHMNNYFSRCEMVINAWREKGPQYLDPELSYFDGGASQEEISRAHGIYLIRNGSPTNYFAPNFEPPYTTKMTRSLLTNVINKSWDKVRRDWAPEPLGNLTSANAIISRLFGCADPTVLSYEDKRVIFTATPKEQPEKKQIKNISNDVIVEKTASSSDDTHASMTSSNSKISAKSLMDSCPDEDSPDKKQQQGENTMSAIHYTPPSDNNNVKETPETARFTRSKSDSSSVAGSTNYSNHVEAAELRSMKSSSSNAGSVASAKSSNREVERQITGSKLESSFVVKGRSSLVAGSAVSASTNKSGSSKLRQTEEVNGSGFQVTSSKKNGSSIAGSAVSAATQKSLRIADTIETTTTSDELSSRRGSSVAGSAVSAAKQKSSTTTMDMEEASWPNEVPAKKGSSVAGIAVSDGTVSQKYVSKHTETEEASEEERSKNWSSVAGSAVLKIVEPEVAPKEVRSKNRSSIAGSAVSAATTQSKFVVAEKTSVSKDARSKKGSSVAGSAVSAATTHHTSSQFSDAEEVFKEARSKDPSDAGIAVSSSARLTTQKTSSKFVETEEASVSEDVRSKIGSLIAGSAVTTHNISRNFLGAEEVSREARSKAPSIAGSAVSSSSRLSSGFVTRSISKIRSKESKGQPEPANDSSFESMVYDNSFGDSFFSHSTEEKENTYATMSPLNIAAGDTSLDTAKSTPQTDNKRRASRLTKIRQERLGWSMKRDELGEKKDISSLEAKQDAQHFDEGKSIKPSNGKDLISSNAKENSLKYEKQSRQPLMVSSPKRDKLGKMANIDSPQNSLAYSVDESTFDPFGNLSLEDVVASSDKQHNGKQESAKHNQILQTASSASTTDSLPSDEELFTIGWAKALDPKTGYYYYFTLDRSKTVWENPLATTL